MSKAMKVVEGEIAENGEPKLVKNGGRKTTVVPITSADTAASWLQTIERLAPVIGIEGVRELMTMRREEQALVAAREFNAAMALAQAELEPVARNQKNKQTGSNYADLAAIAKAAMPIIHKHGFGAITSEFDSKKPDHLGVALKVTHSAGHSERYEFNVPWDGAGLKGNANKTPTHAYSSTLSYGERYAKCKVFGISTEDDDGNAASAGALINDVQIADIKEQIAKYEADTNKLCDFMNVEDLGSIPASKYEAALAYLDAKRRYGGKK